MVVVVCSVCGAGWSLLMALLHPSFKFEPHPHHRAGRKGRHNISNQYQDLVSCVRSLLAVNPMASLIPLQSPSPSGCPSKQQEEQHQATHLTRALRLLGPPRRPFLFLPVHPTKHFPALRLVQPASHHPFVPSPSIHPSTREPKSIQSPSLQGSHPLISRAKLSRRVSKKSC
ncbi:hypothetical protein IWZ01DRAFT_222598 [Phyllosticta capitalensis]